jgi:transcriptional regulator with XRE-family HTH domain
MKYFSANLKYLRQTKGVTQAEIEASTGIERTTWSNYERGKSYPNLKLFHTIANFFGIPEDDLLNSDLSHVNLNSEGETAENGQSVNLNVNQSVNLNAQIEATSPGIYQGMPAVVTVDTSGRDNVVFVPVKARAGYLLGYGDGDYISTLPAYSIPGLHGATYRAFEVDGHSMFNTLHDHDVVIAKWATSADFRDDRVFVIVTKTDGMLVKRCIFREGKIIAKSDNNHKGEYPTIVLELAEVAEIWYVVQRWTRQLSQPGEIFRRVIDLEAKMALLEGRLSTP